MTKSQDISPIVFPQDEGIHPDAKTEWWYFNGHLEAEDGTLFDFFGALTNAPSVLEVKFNPDHWHPPVNFPNLLGTSAWQAALTVRSPNNDPRHFPINELRPYLFPWSLFDHHGLTQGRLDNTFQTWEGPQAHMVRKSEDTLSLQAPFGNGVQLNLDCTSKLMATPMLEGGKGAVHMGPLGWSRYYSFPVMQASGSVTLDGVVYTVKGRAWFDHQWGDMSLDDGYKQWRWVGIQLDDGTGLVTFEFVDGAKGQVQSDATWQHADGTQEALESLQQDGQAPVLVVTDEGEPWTSPATGARYPLTPRLQIAALDVDLRLRPVMFSQEMVGMGPKNILTGGHFFPDFWEGACSVTGTVKGKPVTGKAYYELLGYNANTPDVVPMSPELPEKVGQDLMKMFTTRKDSKGKPVT